MPRIGKQGLVLLADTIICVLSVLISFYLRLGYFLFDESIIITIFISLVIALPLFIFSGLYLSVFRYSGWLAIYSVFKTIIVYSLFYTLIITVISIDGIPRTIGIIQPILLLLGIAGMRIAIYLSLSYLSYNKTEKNQIPDVLIYGAGKAGIQLVAALESSNEMFVRGYLDDNVKLQGKILNSKPIYSPNELEKIIKKFKISHILLAIPSVSHQKRKRIIDNLSAHKVIVRTLPSITGLTSGKITFSDIQDLDIEDLLARDTVIPYRNLLSKNITNKIVAITGAGGSIGSELCKQIINLGPKKILLIESSEYSLYTIHSELIKIRSSIDEIDILPILANIQDQKRLKEIFETWSPDTIYHAAAYKHVPLVEYNLVEGIKNNVIGTINLAKLAIEFNTSSFVMISTDKAVRPTNVMGASKRLAEICLQSLFDNNQNERRPNISMVRFGNVIDSSGSVIPLFKRQILEGGPVTITHSEISRYFMTVSEAAQLVIQAGAMAKGGDVFVLDMGKPIKIVDLAKRMISLSGFTILDDENPDGDIRISIIGLRPGEKLYEELLLGKNPQITEHLKILRAQDPFILWEDLKKEIEYLEQILIDGQVLKVNQFLMKLIPEFNHSGNVVDTVYLQQKKNYEL